MSQIYFISDGRAIKIGRSARPGQRLRELETGNPFPINIIACIEGSAPQERSIHIQLAKYRIRGEWFVDCTPVRRAIEQYQKSGVICAAEKAPCNLAGIDESPESAANVAEAIVSLTSDPRRLERLEAELAALKENRMRLEVERSAR